MNLSTWLAAPLIAFLICPPVGAACRRRNCAAPVRVVKVAKVVEKVAVVAEVIPVAVLQPVLVQVQPLYGAAYVSPPVAPVAAAPVPARAARTSAETQSIMSTLRAFDGTLKAFGEDLAEIKKHIGLPAKERAPAKGEAPARMDKAEEEPEAPAKGEAKEQTALSVFQNRCLACHGAAPAKGTTFSMFAADKSLLKLTDRQWLKVSARLSSGTMPPKSAPTGVATDEEAQIVSEWLATRD